LLERLDRVSAPVFYNTLQAAKDAARERTAGVLASLPDSVLRRMTQDLDALAAAFTIAEVNPER
jgi:hypothetical protein